MVQGVQIKVDTTAAIRAQEDFDAATKRTFGTLDEQAKRIRELETRLRDVAVRQAEASSSQKSGVDALAAYAASLRQYSGATDTAAKSTTVVAVQSRVATAEVGKVGASVNATAGIMQRLAATAGSTGAARALGLFASGARAIVASINPVGIAIGLAASAAITLSANALAAETSLDRLGRRAQEAQENFSLLDEASGRVSSALANAAKNREAAFGGGRDDAIARQTASVQALGAALAQLQQSAALDGGFRLTIEDAKKLGEVLDFGTRELKDLEAAAKSSGAERLAAIARLREEAGLQIDLVRSFTEAANEATNPYADGSSGTAVVSAESAIAALERAMAAAQERVRALRDDAAAAVDPFRELLRTQIKQFEQEKLGSREREARQRVEQLTTSRGGAPLTDEQKRIADAAIANARAFDEQERAAKQLAETERERQRQADESARAAEKVAAAEQRRADVLDQLRDDTAVLLAVTDQEIRAKKELARLNDAIRQADVKPGSDAAKQIEFEVRRNERAREYAETLDKIGQAGGEAFGAIGQGLANAALNGGTLREMLAGIYQDLLRLAAQRAIVDNLVQAGTIIARGIGSYFGAGSTTPSGPSTAQQFGLLANGGLVGSSGPMAFAARGMLLDSYQTLRAGGTNITVAEGGESTPEAIVPLQRDRYGRLGVSGGGGGDIIVNMPGVRSAREARQARPTVRQMMGQLQREQQRGMRAGT